MEKKTVKEFAESIKNKYPQYAEIDDVELTEKILAKYPQYKDMVDLDSGIVKKKEPTTTEQDQPQEETITEDSSTVAEPSQESGQSIDFNQVKYGIRPTGSTEEVPVEEAPIEEAVPVEPTGVDKLQSIEQEQDALSQNVNELNLAFNNAETPEEKQDIADQYKETVDALNQLYKDKQIALAEDNTFINKDGQYVNMQAAAEAAIKNKYAFNVIPRLDATEKKPEVADKFYTPKEVIDAEESALPEFDKRIEELRDDDYFKRHIGDFIREKNKILEEKKASVRNIEQARTNNMDIMMAEFGAKYKIDDKEVSRSAFKDYLRSNEGNDRIKENGKMGLQVYNDEAMSEFLDFQEEASKNILGEESLRGFVATTKSFIDGIDIRLAEALIGVSIVADLDQEATENMLLKSGMRGRNLKKALENAKGKEGNFRDNFLQAYAASVKEDTEKIRGIRMLKSYDALDLLMSGDVTGFTSDIVGMSIESLPYTAMAMTGIGGTALLYNSVQANEYYDLRAQGVEKERALIASNMTASIETVDAILERIIFKNSLNSVSGLINKAGRLAGYTQKEIASLRRDIAEAFIKEWPTEFTQGSSGAITNQWALGEEIDFNKASRQGVIEGFATVPTTTLMTSPQMLQLAYAPIKKHRDMIKMESAVEDLLSASIDPENESDRSLLLNQANKIVNDIVKQKKEIEETASKVTPIQRGALIDLTVEEMTLEAASEATGISKTSKELIDEKIKDVRERKDNLLNNVKETSPTPKAAEGGIKPETSENYANLTEDGEGNFVFYHVTNVDLEEVDPSKYGTGENRQTSREETNEVAKVGGVSMYYTSEKDGEKMVTGKNKYQVKVAKENVYDANEDPLNLKEKARELHEKEYSGKTYNGNTELAYMTKLAGEKGFEMVVGAWSGKTRAQSTQKLKPHDVQVSEGNTVKKPFEKRYKQNIEKGWSPSMAVPFTKNVQPILDKITAIFNSKKDYANPLYNASAAYNYEFGEKFSKFESQEQLTELVNSSNEIPQELKDEYNNALNAGDIKGSSTREFNDNPETEPSYIENTPEGHYVNIGMVRGKDGQEMSADDIKRALPDDVTIEEETELAVGENVEEPTLSLKLSRPLTSEEILDLRNSTGQLAIPQLSNGEGIMYGTLDWGPFNSEFFVLPNKIKLSENEKATKGNRLFNKPLKAVKEIANRYYKRIFGGKREEFFGTKKIDKKFAKRISNAYEAMKHDPNNPEVKAAYDALIKETLDQYQDIIDAGYVIEINNNEPYNNSQDMITDLEKNKTIKILSTESEFGDKKITNKQREENPMLAETKYKDKNGLPLLANDIFRAVHDFFGHAELGNGFGPLGEENAWNVHARMYSPLARRAMTTETRGQNSWVNFSGINDEAFKKRDRARQLRREGKEEEAKALAEEVYNEMIFAEQKVGLLPEEFSELSDNDFDEQEVKDLETLTKTKRKSKYTKPSLNQKLKEEAVKAMNEMDEAQVNFKEPKGAGKKTNPLVNIGKIIKKYFGKPVKSLVMKVEDFQGIPMFLGMSDILAAGTVKDSSGKDMNVNGGLLFGLTKGNNNLSWAGVNKKGAKDHLKRAMYLYESHKALFDRLWKEGKLPDGHIPMAIMRMSDTAVLSNEAFFRYSLNLIKSASKEKNVKSLQVFIDAAKIRVETLAKKESLNKNEKDELQSLSRVIDLGPKVKTMSGLFEYIINDAKKNEDSTWPLALKASLAKKLFGSTSNKGEKNSRPWVIELFGEPSSELYLNNIYKGIGDESVIDVDPGYILGIMGVDVKNNPGVSQANHDNYGWGANGRIIAFFENPADGMDIFPEFFAKASRVFTQSSSGKTPSMASVPAQVRGAAFIDKAFIGVRISTKMSDIDTISGTIRYAFPNVQVASTQEEFDEIMSTEGVREKRDPDGNLIAGITINGKIYINPSVANLSTPIHEFGHIWMDYLRSKESGSKGTALYERGMSLVDGKIELEKAKELYPELTLEQQKEEALVELIATRGASIIEAGKKSDFISWLNAVYEYVKSKLVKSKDLSIRNIKSLSLEQFADIALADLFGVEEINAKFNPQMEQYAMESRFSKKRAADMSMYSIIKEARLNNFSDGAIKEFLRREGYAAKDISSALEVPKSLMKSVPQSFGLIEGGMIKGIELYDRIAKGLAKSKSLKEMRQKAQDLLYSTDEYKKASDNLKKQMAYDLDKSLATSENKEVAKEMRDIRAELMSRKRGAKELQFIKAKLRTFIRKNIPQSLYEKKEVMDLISAVTNATPENIQAIVKDVNDLVVKHGVKTARNRIAKALNVKLNKLESGRLKGKILPEDQDLISGLISNMLTEEATPEDIENMSERLRKRYNELDSKNNLNQREYEEMILIDLALNYNNSLLMEDNDVLKLQSLEYVSSSIEDIKTGARMRMKFALTEQKEYYNQIKNEFFKDVTGLDIDFNNDQSVLNSRQEIRDRQAKVDNRPRFKKFVENFFSPVSNIVTRIEGMEGLLDKVSRMAGEMFEGKSIELILDRIDDANIEFKMGRNAIMKTLDAKAQEIFGSNHRKIMIKNSKPTEFYYSNPQKVQDLVDKLTQETDPKEKKKIEKEIDSYKMPISQNEMYYIYNQAKDKANLPGFESTFGPQYESIIEHITNKLGPKVKEWADWQVDVFFPSVYEKYNAVYREIYRTDMPWNAMYAGRIHREGDADQVNLLENTNQYQTSVGGASTKVRIKNKKKIRVVDGDSNLNSYINEMEFFAHYSEPMRDITKMISNPDIKDGIIATTGEDAYKVLKGQLDKVMNRNSAKGTDIKILNFLSNAFVKAKLGLSPVIFLKQTTSAIAFADYIGYRDWAKNLLSNNLASNWSELYANSVYLQDRYEQSDISKVLENYTAKNEVSFLDNVQADKVNNFLMYMIKQGDKMGVMGSIPNYIYYKENFMARGMDEQSAIKEAVKKVERQIKTTQQSNDIQDKDFFQTSEPLYRMLNLFMSSPRALMRKEIIATRNLYRKMTGQQSKGSVKDNLRTFFTYHVAIPLFFQYVSLGFPGLLRNWRDDDKDDLIWAMILGNINAVFALGDIAVAIKDVATNKPWAGGMSQIPFFQSAQDIIDNYKRFSNASKDETKNKYFSKMIIGILEPASGIPVANIAKFGENYSKLATGDVDDFGEALLRLFNYSEYAIKGPKVKDTKSTSTSRTTSRSTSRSTRQTTRSSRTR